MIGGIFEGNQFHSPKKERIEGIKMDLTKSVSNRTANARKKLSWFSPRTEENKSPEEKMKKDVMFKKNEE